jgi:hypothetical protein
VSIRPWLSWRKWDLLTERKDKPNHALRVTGGKYSRLESSSYVVVFSPGSPRLSLTITDGGMQRYTRIRGLRRLGASTFQRDELVSIPTPTADWSFTTGVGQVITTKCFRFSPIVCVQQTVCSLISKPQNGGLRLPPSL